MYTIESFNGKDLSDKSLCITFDDGPGEHSYEIGKFLFEEGIAATFFVVGKYAYQHPEVLQALKDFGHLIGNHTFEHPDMPFHRSVNGDVIDQIVRTDLVINKFINGNTTYFRSPYGKWSAEVASDLNLSPMASLDHVGPIHWDMGGMDCYFWKLDRLVEDACSEYYAEISKIKRGILLFHDEIADMDDVKPKNKTLQLLKLLIPKLKNEGYTFVALDTIKAIAKAAIDNSSFYIKTKNNKFLSLKKNNPAVIQLENKTSEFAEFCLKQRPFGKVALKCNNLFLSTNGIKISIEKMNIEPDCLFDWISVTKNSFMLRNSSGNYLSIDKENTLVATAEYMRLGHLFFYCRKNATIKSSLTFRQKLSLLRKRLLYVKSKVLEIPL